ncbi:MAG: Nramp family divalent metal transporter [Pseudohongiella sp.]|nr:Nramp family divalent metal transporter [Pseudohongiella sp.]MDP2126049.1 Nramp family divalent metal transporter [Pseudohongiella sp.]
MAGRTHTTRRWSRGPGAIVAAAFIGPGTVTVCTLAGVQFGFALLWAMLLSTIATIVLQDMSARIGIVTGRGLGEVIRAQLTRPALRFVVLALIMFAIVAGNAAYEAGNISGARLGLETLIADNRPEIAPLLSVLIGAIAFGFLYQGSYRVLERVMVSLVLVMSLAFLLTAVLTRPDIPALLRGLLIPSVNDASILTIVGLIGTTVVPYNLFLHAALVKEKWQGTQHLSDARYNSLIAITMGGLVSMAIIVSAAAVNSDGVNNAVDLARGLEPLFGSFARYFLSMGLFAAGITSAMTAPLAAAFVARGCLGWSDTEGGLKSLRFRAVWIFVLFMGVVFSSLGINPIDIIRAAQVANGITLPVVVGIILWLVNQSSVLGEHRNNLFQNIAGGVIFLVTIALGVRAIVLVVNAL